MKILSKLFYRIEDETFTRPNLSADGTMGGSAFAVSAIGYSYASYIYKAVDSSPSTCWQISFSTTPVTSSNPIWYILYNPEALNIKSLTVTSPANTSNEGMKYHRTIRNATLQGSNDNSSWEDITSVSGEGKKANTVFNCSTNTKYYKYHRILVTAVNPYSPNKSYYGLNITDISITATYEVNG